jgi:hypothetical protein
VGLSTTVGLQFSGVRFDANMTHHHHYRCVRCGWLRHFESSEFNSLPIPDSVQRFGEVVSAQWRFEGYVPNVGVSSHMTPSG